MPADGQQNNYAEDVLGTKYPYYDVKQGSIAQFFAGTRSSIAGMNPFALQQIPTQQRMAVGPRYGNQFYYPDPYPNAVNFQRMFPSHYDPLKEMNRGDMPGHVGQYAPGPYSIYAVTSDKLPRPCTRAVTAYKKCKQFFGEERCREEGQDVMEVCPNWSVDELKEKSRQRQKFQALDMQQYKRAMEVSSYNEGRKLGDVSSKTWIDGTRKYLRPDTMYADERYVNITQPEINEAKARLAAKQKDEPMKHPKAYDHLHQNVKQEKPIYP